MVAFEVACKIGKGVNPDLFDRGWHATSVIGVLGAAAAAGKLLRLDAQKMAFALALAASQASGLKGNFGTMGKPFHAGKAAESGVVAALLSASGFTACPDILDVKNGFCDVFYASTIWTLLFRDWAILLILFLPESSPRSTHRASSRTPSFRRLARS